MNILRKMVVSLFAAVLSAALLGLAWSNVGLSTVRNRDTVKGWLDKSGFYNQVVDVVLEKAKDATKNGESDIPVNDPQIQAIAKKAFTPEFLKENIERVLDGSYSWVDGTTDKLAFSIDLTSAKQQLATGLGDYVKTRVAALPVCATGQVPAEFDSFNATCRPAAISAEQAGQKVSADLLTNKEFLPNPVLTADNFKVNKTSDTDPGVPLESTEQAKIARKSYRLSGYVPLALAAASVVMALGIIFLSSDHLAGLRRTGWILITNGIILLVTYVVLTAVTGAVDRKLAETANGSVAQNQLISDFVRVIFADIKKALLPFVVGYIGLGIGAVITGGTLKKRRDGSIRKEVEGHKDMLPEPKQKPTDEKTPEAEPTENDKKPEPKKAK